MMPISPYKWFPFNLQEMECIELQCCRWNNNLAAFKCNTGRGSKNRPKRTLNYEKAILAFSALYWQLSVIQTWYWHSTVSTTNEVQGKCTPFSLVGFRLYFY